MTMASDNPEDWTRTKLVKDDWKLLEENPQEWLHTHWNGVKLAHVRQQGRVAAQWILGVELSDGIVEVNVGPTADARNYDKVAARLAESVRVVLPYFAKKAWVDWHFRALVLMALPIEDIGTDPTDQMAEMVEDFVRTQAPARVYNLEDHEDLLAMIEEYRTHARYSVFRCKKNPDGPEIIHLDPKALKKHILIQYSDHMLLTDIKRLLSALGYAIGHQQTRVGGDKRQSYLWESPPVFLD